MAAITTIQSECFSFILGKIFERAEPAANKLTALAVIEVKIMTNNATIPSPNLLAIVEGSELLALYTPEVIAMLIVEIKPIIANQITPVNAPKNGAIVELCFFLVKRVKSAPAVTQAKLKAAT